MATSSVSVADSALAKSPAQSDSRVPIRDFSMVIALVVIWGFFAIASPNFISARNLSNLTVELSITAILSLGMLLVILGGYIDLSIGSGVGLLGAISAVLLSQHNWPAPLAMLVAIIVAVIIWFGMGALIVTQRIPAFIITLAGLLVFKGLHWKVIQNSTIPVTHGGEDNLYSLLTTWYLPPIWGIVLGAAVFALLATGTWRARQRRESFGLSVDTREVAFARLLVTGQLIALFVLVCNGYQGIPLSALILAAAAFMVWVLTQHTRFGRYLYAIGGNEEAAHVSGIPVTKVVIGTFVIMGLITALGGFMQTAYAGSSTTTTGELLELDAIAACVIGGTSLKGGRGNVVGVLFGSLIMASLLNGMTLMAISPEIKYIARGLVLALAVWMDVRLNKGK
ncbi:xylose transport system permease protein XylH [Abditibacteriota bacterium]|nr:xylose transport system permease protein XylH [Abditibacteriota bacterium]